MLRSGMLSVAMALALAVPAHAGNIAEPVMEAEVIAEEAAGTGGGWILPLVMIAVIAAVASSSGGGDTPLPPDLGPVLQ